MGPALIIIFLAAVLTGCKAKARASETGSEAAEAEEASSDATAAYPITASAFLLDTYCTVGIYDGTEEALDNALTLLSELDTLLSPSGDGSEIEKINESEEERVEISEETAALFLSVVSVYESAGGDLEVTIEPLSSIWNFHETNAPPDDEELINARAKLSYLGYSIEKDGESWYFVKDDSELCVDVGAFAKGYVADRLKEELINEGVTSAIINLGGNVLCVGKRPDGEPFSVGIKDPDNSDSYVEVVKADDVSVVTAGIYERYFEYEGVRYHHILNPKTGLPADTGLISVTVVGEKSVICDALSTAILVKGKDEGLSYLEYYNETYGEDYEAYLIDEDRKIVYSEEEVQD